MDNFRTIYRILHYLERAMDFDEADIDFISCEHLGISEQRWTAIIEMLSNAGYIDGISIKRSIGGETMISLSSPRITLKGLEYLKENSFMKKAASLAKGIAGMIP